MALICILGISPLTLLILALKVVLVAELVKGFLSSIFFILALYKFI